MRGGCVSGIGWWSFEGGRRIEVVDGLRSGQPADWPRRRALVLPPRMSESEWIADWTVGHIPLLKPVKEREAVKQSAAVPRREKVDGGAAREEVGAGDAERKVEGKGKKSEKGKARKTYRIPRERR